MRWLLGCLSLLLVVCLCPVQAEAQMINTGQIYNHHSELNLIVWRSTLDENGDPIGDGEEWGLLLPGMKTPTGEDWDFACIEPQTSALPDFWYKCTHVTFWNLHFEGHQVFWADIFWCYVPPLPFGGSVLPTPTAVSPWAFEGAWTPTKYRTNLPAEAFVPLPGAEEF